MQSQAGFSFTELLTMATVMAMLAAVAVPRHAALDSESRAGAVLALAANIRSSASVANRIWRAAGQPPQLDLDGRRIEMRYGYPAATSMERLVVISREFHADNGYFKHVESADGLCAVLYIPPQTPTVTAEIISYTDGC